MSGTHSYTSWISMFSISLFFVSITSLACSDVSKTICSWQLTLSVTWCSCLHWSIRSLFFTFDFIFSQWLYFPLDFGCMLVIFPFLHSSFSFILYSTSTFPHSFSFLSFTSSLLLLGILCCPSSSSSKTSFISFEEIYFLHSLDFQTFCLPSSSDMDASCKIHLHV